ncbi:MAG TPA: AgmX/PglI C-terminal domain-containing protein [Steroidobacteraceae bacterium]|jgi:protein TonB|nr:AgmX/PglI C-terminal domain-containing protein [Steroidobacteraceae bacterium]
MQLTPYYRSFDLAWEQDPEEQGRLRKLVTAGLLLLLLLGLIIPFIHLPKATEAPEAVPERLARLMVQEKPKPPPPPPVELPKPKPETKPVEVPKPVDKVAEARKKAEKSINKLKDELADLRQNVDLTPLGQTKNLQGAVGQDSHAERSLIASKAGSGSAGITSANASRGFGTGAGSLTGHDTTSVNSRIAAAGSPGNVSRGVSGKPSRSEEEIALVFDRNKGAIYALYGRALRDTPDLQGKLVLEFTISPSGEVTECHVVSSELKDPDLERKIVARVKLFRFEAKDVASITTTKPIEFVPST